MTHTYYVTIKDRDTSYWKVNDATGQYQVVTKHDLLDKTRYTISSGGNFLMPNGGISKVTRDHYKTQLALAIRFHKEQ